jgi:hypothetical protein
MAQEDKGLILRGLLLFGAISLLVVFVLTVMFWRAEPPTTTLRVPSENSVPSAPGWDIRYNAATTLARRGSKAVPWLLIREILDEQQQLRNNQVRLKDGREVYDEAAARAYMISGLRALAAWHEKRSADPTREVPAELREIYPVVDKLAESEVGELKAQAEKARRTFFR